MINHHIYIKPIHTYQKELSEEFALKSSNIITGSMVVDSLLPALSTWKGSSRKKTKWNRFVDVGSPLGYQDITLNLSPRDSISSTLPFLEECDRLGYTYTRSYDTTSSHIRTFVFKVTQDYNLYLNIAFKTSLYCKLTTVTKEVTEHKVVCNYY